MTWRARPLSAKDKQHAINKSLRGLETLTGKSFDMDLSDPVSKPRVKSDIPSEHAEQVAFVRWFRLAYPTVRIFAIPNGGFRGAIEATNLKAEGVAAGVPDLYVPAWKLWIEMKRTKNHIVSDAQFDWHAYLSALGDTVILGIGCEDAVQKVQEFACSLS